MEPTWIRWQVWLITIVALCGVVGYGLATKDKLPKEARPRPETRPATRPKTRTPRRRMRPGGRP